MDLKERWDQFTRLGLGDIKLEFSFSTDMEKFEICSRFIRETAKLRQLVEEIQNSIDDHRRNVRAVERRYRTIKSYFIQGEELYRQNRTAEALRSLNNAISESPLALIKASSNVASDQLNYNYGNDTSEEESLNSDEPYRECANASCRSSSVAAREDLTLREFQRRHSSDVDGYRCCLADCFALRGQILLRKNMLKEAETDLLLSLRLQPSRTLKCSLYFLLGESQRQQGKVEKASESYNKCLELLQAYKENISCILDLPSSDTVHSAIVSCTTVSYSNGGLPDSEKLPVLANGENCSIACGSKLIKVNFTEEKGRFLEASDNIKAGDTLIVESPYAAVLLPEYYDTHCYHCLEPLVVPYPCMQCRHVRFCSPKCSEEAWDQYHNVECQIWPLIETVDALTRLSIRSLLVADKDEVLDVINTLEQSSNSLSERIPGLSPTGVYDNNYRAVHHLVTNANLQPEQALFTFSLTASVVASFLSQAIGCRGVETKSLEDSCRDIKNSIRRIRSNESLRQSSRKQDIPHVNSIAAAFKRSRASLADEDSQKYSRSLDESDLGNRFSHFDSLPNRGNKCSSCDNIAHTPEYNFDIWTNCFSDCKFPLTESQLGSLLLHHLKQMSCNVFAVTKLVTFNQDDSSRQVGSQSTRKEPRRIAVAIYPTSCLLNHSCDPDVIISFIGKNMVVKATHNILPGEEITHCYGPHVGHMIRAARQKMLRNQYYFTCSCGACRRDEEHEKEQLCRLSLMCPVCRGSLKVTYETDRFVGSCGNPLCGSVSTVTKELQQFQETKEELADALTVGRRGDVRKSLSLLQAVLRKRTAILLSKDRYVGEVHDALARCFTALGDWGLASYHCSLNIEAVEQQYGSTSLELAHQLHRLSQLLFRGKYTKKAIDVVERSIKLLSLHYGKDYPQVKDLLKIRHCLKSFSSPVSQFVI